MIKLKKKWKYIIILQMIFFFYFILIQNDRFKLYFKDIFQKIDISVIIPVYNNEKYLSLCLNSIINQTIKNIEIICIDDGSNDKSLQILKRFRSIDNRIIIVHQKNLGPGISKNKGIKMSKGKFLAFIDSDDLYPDIFTLQILLNNAIKNKVLICGGGLKNFYQRKRKLFIIKNNSIEFMKQGLIKYINYQYDYYYQRFIYNKNFIKKHKLYFPNFLRFEDPPFFIKAMAIANNFYAIKNITYLHRILSKTIFFNERKIIDIYKGIKKCLDISISMKLYKLYCLLLSRLNSKFIINNAKKFIKSKRLKHTISLALDRINFDIIKKINFVFTLDKFYNQL